MLALIIVLLLVVALLAVLVAGLLRSHADILRALHELGAGVGDPAGGPTPASGLEPQPPAPPPLHLGPPLPAERSVADVHDLVGVTPEGDARAVAVDGADGLVLLTFLSSGCTTCAGVWTSLADPAAAGLPAGVRVVAVTKGPEFEIPAEVAARRAPGTEVVMSTDAWQDYEVPGSPFFVLVDGGAGRRLGEGVAHRLDQVAELVRRAQADERPPEGHRGPGTGLDGKAREARNDRELLAAGIGPGDPRLYPRRREDLFAPGSAPGPQPEGGDGA